LRLDDADVAQQFDRPSCSERRSSLRLPFVETKVIPLRAWQAAPDARCAYPEMKRAAE
jgi:hypothetical protein